MKVVVPAKVMTVFDEFLFMFSFHLIVRKLTESHGQKNETLA